MLERLQSALKTVKDYKPPSFTSHRFVTVRRGSPAARSGQIQPGDQLEAVEGRPVRGLQHRDLAQILRRAGNALRLSITPKHQGADVEIDSQMIKGSRLRPKDESQFYSVDLDRGPTGFGFSLRGGSEYNMGLYVLGLMDGGPAQRSNKIQVSDQLVEINGDTTSGMTHSQAVEQIRRGGHRIHLVLKTGNGYVPDYGPEEGALSPSSSSHTEEQDVAPVTMTTASPRKQMGHGVRGKGKRRKMRSEGETKRTGGGERLGPPDLDLDLVEDEAKGKEKRRSQTVRQKEERETQEEQGRRSRSLPGNAARFWHTSEPEERLEVEEPGGGVRERRRRSAVKSRRRATEERREDRDDITNRHTKHSGGSATTQRAVFSFLGPMEDNMESESAASFSDVSQSACSVAAAGWEKEFDWRRSTREQGKAPGPWLEPSPQRLTRVLIGSRLRGRELEGGLSL